MSRSTRFPAAIHILTLLALKRGECTSSEWLSQSLGTNAVVVRRIIGLLKEAGFVESQAGVQGGTMLAVKPEDISLRDIYMAVEEDSVFCMHAPHPKCSVACCVKEKVDALLTRAEDSMKDDLGRTKLSSITKLAAKEYQLYADKAKG